MSQIITKFIANNAVTDEKILLRNANFLRGRNAGDTADVDLVQINASDEIEFGKLPFGPNSNAPTSDSQLSNKKYVDDQVAALATAAEWQESCVGAELDSSGLSPSSGDRFLA